MKSSGPAVLFGVDRFLRDEAAALGSRRVALVTHDAAVAARRPWPLCPSRVALLRAGVRLVALFAPEHGLEVSVADGASVGDGTDALTGLPARSLYGGVFRPGADSLDGIDLVLVDLQDVGSRFYTYIWTMSHVLETCAAAGVPVWVLDRPNPLGGDLTAAEGPLFDESLPAGLVGRWAIPIRHSLTIGELARLWTRERKLGAALRVIPMEGWHRALRWPALNTPFVPTSPAMPSYETALLYPGTGLLEALNVNEGRGTAWPFRVVGAPWMDGLALAEALVSLRLPGVAVRSIAYTPTASRHAGAACRGVMLHVTDETRLRPVATGLHLIAAIWRLHRDACAWTTYPTAANPSGRGHFDHLVGRSGLTGEIASGRDLSAAIRAWTAVRGWRARVRRDLLYD